MAKIKYEVEKTLHFTENEHTSILQNGSEAYLCFNGAWIYAIVVDLRPKSMVIVSPEGKQFVQRYSHLEAISDKQPKGAYL